MVKELSTENESLAGDALDSKKGTDGGAVGATKVVDSGTFEDSNGPDLRQVIQESQKRLADEDQAPPRRRGRPRKDGGSTSQPRRDAGPSAGAGAVTGISAQSLSPILSIAIKLPYDAWANNTKCDGVRLDEDEAKALSEQLDQCAKAYFPNLSEKGSILIATIASFGIITLAKYNTLMEFKKANTKTHNPKEVESLVRLKEDDKINPLPSDSQEVSVTEFNTRLDH